LHQASTPNARTAKSTPSFKRRRIGELKTPSCATEIDAVEFRRLNEMRRGQARRPATSFPKFKYDLNQYLARFGAKAPVHSLRKKIINFVAAPPVRFRPRRESGAAAERQCPGQVRPAALAADAFPREALRAGRLLAVNGGRRSSPTRMIYLSIPPGAKRRRASSADPQHTHAGRRQQASSFSPSHPAFLPPLLFPPRIPHTVAPWGLHPWSARWPAGAAVSFRPPPGSEEALLTPFRLRVRAKSTPIAGHPAVGSSRPR